MVIKLINTLNKLNLFKVFFVIVFTLFFIKTFIYGDITKPNWTEKYSIFSVPANSYPGGDARNIKSAAACSGELESYFYSGSCSVKQIEILNENYPSDNKLNIPSYNYPPIWADIYAIFNDESEGFFLKFWKLNALLLFFTVLVLTWKFNYKLFPLLLLSPVTLLAIERGNVDALVFSILFLPMLFFYSKAFFALLISIATVLKIYPFFGYLYLIFYSRKDLVKSLVLLLPVVPLGLYSAAYLLEYIGNTSYGTAVAFGAFSLTNLSFFESNKIAFYLIFLIFYSVIFCLVYYFSPCFIDDLKQDIMKNSEKEIALLFVSLSIVVLLFIFFTSWAYRFIFIFPALVILSHHRNLLSKLLFIGLLSSLWLPLLPYGWFGFNFAFYFTVPLMFFLIFFVIKSGGPKLI